MAKIDVSTIEGYENMTAEQKLAALESFEFADPDYSGYVKKETADKYATEAANLKKQLRERMSAEEAEKQAREEAQQQMMTELESLRHDRAVDKHKAKFLEMGYPAALAEETAAALADGDTDKVFANQAKFLEEREKQIRGELLKETKRPPNGQGKVTLDKEQFRKLSLMDKLKYAEENPEIYKEIYGGS